MASESTRFGTVGMEVGPVGRWYRLVFGLLIVSFLVADLWGDSEAAEIAFLLETGAYLSAITIGYLVLYYVLGEAFLSHGHAWINTLIFVALPYIVGLWDLLFEPLLGFDLPTALQIATVIYIGISFVLEWRIKYGGCEVVALPIIVTRKRYVSYCIPLVTVDAAEKGLIESPSRLLQAVWGGLLAIFLALFTAQAVGFLDYVVYVIALAALAAALVGFLLLDRRMRSTRNPLATDSTDASGDPAV